MSDDWVRVGVDSIGVPFPNVKFGSVRDMGRGKLPRVPHNK